MKFDAQTIRQLANDQRDIKLTAGVVVADALDACVARIAELEAALLRVVQEDNACIDLHGGWIDSTTRPMDRAPCGAQGGTWGALQCGCAEEAANRLKR